MSRCPIFPKPSEKRTPLYKMFFKKSRSWMDALYARSYQMKMGEIQLPARKLFMVNDLKEVRKMMIEQPDAFPKHDILGEILRPLLGDSIFTTNGETWQTQRDLLIPGFKQNTIDQVFMRMSDAVEAMSRRIEARDLKNAIDIEPEMTLVTADIIFRAILSSSIEEDEASKVLAAFASYQRKSPMMAVLRTFGVPNNVLLKRFDKKRVKEAKVIRRAIECVVESRFLAFQAGERKDDILNAMLETQAANPQMNFSVEAISDQIVMLFLAGHETSAAALSWTFYLLSLYPDEQEKAYDEIMQVNAQDALNFKNMKQFGFLKQVFMESLRLYPPVGFFARQSAETTQMREKTIKPKDAIIVAPWLLHRHQDYWDQPHEFCPHRFAKGDPSPRGAYLPFGMGQRVCIGMSFAMQEAMLILATLLRKYRFELKEGFEPEPVGKITIRSENGMWVKLTPRDAAKKGEA